jgi:putative ABC transport system permease protein
MTTAVVDPVVHGERGRGPARRAIVRWSARLFRREWRQQALLLALVTVAVAATTGGLALATNAPPNPSTTVNLPGADPRLDDDLAAIKAALGPGQVIRHQRLAIPGSVATVDLRAQDTGVAHPTIRVLAGRLPTTTREVAITHRVAAILGLQMGKTWASGDRSFRVVGLVENPQDLHDAFALTTTGGADPPTSVAVVVHGAPDRLPHVNLPSGSPLEIEGVSATSKAAAALAVLALAAMGLLFVGLVAVAGFTVVAQRHLRALGMLASLGANRRHVRLVMVANGGAVGLAGALAGALAGVGGWLTLAPAMETVVGHRIDRFDLPWWGVAAAVCLAIATALVAAWWPARSLSRMSVMAALSGRPPRPRPAHRFATVGCGLLAAGVIGLVLANPAVAPGDSSHQGRLLLVVGLLTATVGLLLLSPLAIGALASRAGRAPVPARLALRDLSRYRARSGAALAAVTLAVVIAASISVTAAYQSAGNGPSLANLPANELAVYRSDPREPLPDINAEELHTVQQGVATIAAGLGARKTVELDTARDPTSEILQGARLPGRERAALLNVMPESRGGKRIELVVPLYLATPAILDHDGTTPTQIDPTADVVIARSLRAQVTSRSSGGRLVLGANPRHTIDPKIQTLNLPTYSSRPVALITSHGVAALGLQPIVAGWLVETAHTITAAQIGSATRTAAGVGLTVEAADSHSASQLGADASVAGIVLALGVLAMTVGLIRAETANDLRTLTATGATARTRRALTGATAGSLALLGVLLGVVGAYAEAIAWYHHRLGPLGHPPYGNLLTIAVGLPVAAAVGGWALAGRHPPAIARRPLE